MVQKSPYGFILSPHGPKRLLAEFFEQSDMPELMLELMPELSARGVCH